MLTIYTTIVYALDTEKASKAINTIHLFCEADSFQYIYDNPWQDYYIYVRVVYDGREWNNVPLRIRGDGSREHPKKSLKLKFPEKINDWGDTINLNAEYLNLSYLRSCLSSRLYIDSGHPCCRVEHYSVFLNGDYLGLYVRIENIDDYFLKRWDLDTDGNLYKAARDGACMSIYDDINYHWKKKTNKSGPADDLAELIQNLETVKDADFYQFLQTTFDYNALINAFAMNMLISNGSTYYHNYYLYHDIEKSGKWLYIPWDMDLTISAYGLDYPYYRSSGFWTVDNPLLERSILCKPVFKDIKERINELGETWVNSDYLFPIIDSMATVIEYYVDWDTTDNIENLDAWNEAIAKDKYFISNRKNALNSQFTHWPTSFRINRNATVFLDTVYFYWHPATEPANKSITYTLYYSKSKSFSTDTVYTIGNISDTTLAIPAPLEETQYYWYVSASNDYTEVPGYSTYNKFTNKIRTELPPEITANFTLTTAQSPCFIIENTTIHENATLYIEKGVEIIFTDSTALNVNGTLVVKGEPKNPVHLKTMSTRGIWNGIHFNAGPAVNLLSNVQIYNASNINHINGSNDVITADNTNLKIENVSLINCKGGITIKKGNSEITECTLTNPVRIENGSSLIQNNRFTVTEYESAIHINNADSTLLCNNTLLSSGINLAGSSKNIQIVNNKIQMNNAYGIRITDNSTAFLGYNIITNSSTGLLVQDNANVVSYHNTFIENDSTLVLRNNGDAVFECYLSMNNSIISQSAVPLVFDNSAGVQITYSLCDTELLPGEGNLYDGPLFVSDNDFSLAPGSPCIDAGDPATEYDKDGTPPDMGAIPFESIPEIIINEINYHSTDAFNSGDWVELYNTTPGSVNLSGWVFKDENNNSYTLPNDLLMSSHKYLIICQDTQAFNTLYPDIHNITGNFDFGLNNGGELLTLYNKTGIMVDSVHYDDTYPWPTAADGNGPTLELVASDMDNSLPQSWAASDLYGSPGKQNTKSLTSSSSDKLYQNYPNPFTKRTTIQFTGHINNAEIDIYNINGQHIETLYPANNENFVIWDAAHLASGIYFYRLTIDGIHKKTLKAIHLK